MDEQLQQMPIPACTDAADAHLPPVPGCVGTRRRVGHQTNAGNGLQLLAQNVWRGTDGKGSPDFID